MSKKKFLDTTMYKDIPVQFSVQEEIETGNVKFIKAKCNILHVGKNFNGSYFTKEVVNKAIPTLYNSPVIGYIVEKDGERDFDEHNQEVILEKGEYKFITKASAFGIIPESSNITWENIKCSDGETREFLCAEVLLWDSLFPKYTNIIKEKDSVSQSMEIMNISGNYNKKQNTFTFSEFEFSCLCCLGEEVSPAMIDSKVELQHFSLDDFKKEINEKVALYKFSTQLKGGNNQMNQDQINELLSKYSLKQEELDFSFEGLTCEEADTKLNEFKCEKKKKFHNEGGENESNSTFQKEDNETQTEDNQKEQEKQKFSLPQSEFINQIYDKLYEKTATYIDSDGYGYEYIKYYFMDLKDNYVIVYDQENNNYAGIPFTESNDNVNLDFENVKKFISDWRMIESDEEDRVVYKRFGKQIIDMFKTNKNKFSLESETKQNALKEELNKSFNEKYTNLEQQFNSKKSEYDTLLEKYNSLNEYKLTKEKEELEFKKKQLEEKVTIIFNSFCFNEEEIKDLKIKALNEEVDLESLEEKLCALAYKKNISNKKFSKQKDEPKYSFSYEQNKKTNDRYGDYLK